MDERLEATKNELIYFPTSPSLKSINETQNKAHNPNGINAYCIDSGIHTHYPANRIRAAIIQYRQKDNRRDALSRNGQQST